MLLQSHSHLWKRAHFLKTKTEELSLQRNQLTGTFFPEIEGLQALESLDLSHNRLEGELPVDFERLRGLGKDTFEVLREIVSGAPTMISY